MTIKAIMAASADARLIALAYNLRRLFNILNESKKVTMVARKTINGCLKPIFRLLNYLRAESMLFF